MIQSFGDKTSEDIWNGENTTAARKIPQRLWDAAARKLDMINAAVNLEALKVPPGNRLEKLRGSLHGYYSMRVNDQYRITFRWNNGIANNIRIADYH